ncbi:ROK family transcriptional regulator [Microbacterium sp. M28]|uniref:ROK family transcriptional regulator n=1 Tax=Microbacterium sp. M28 TaxID=2962064 RepID=UPI0021F3D97A|nr:ROK family transcriptional regulator [Microbacterium sp. M28]UYO96083.1 ROK family transcriptional regulator [Microbacterium sp. M28]
MSVLRRGTNLPRMGDFNQSVILEAIRRSGEGLSRIELVDATGLSAQTVTNITRRLLGDGLIEEAGRTIKGPGKPRTTLRLIPRSRLSIGVHLDPAVTTVVLLDLSGAVIARSVRRTPATDPMHVIHSMADAIEALLSRAGVDRQTIAGVGVAAPGPLDADRGTVIDPPKLHEWHRVPLRDALADATGLRVALEKDTTAAAFAEVWTGDVPPDASLLFVYLGTGVGAALVLDGEVIRGRSRNVGEVGHIIVDTDGPQCGCGRRGCVEVVCTPQAIVEQAERAGVLELGRSGDDAESVDGRLTALCRLAESGDSGALAVLARAAEHLSVLISALTNMLDVDRVVLGGPFWGRLAPVYLRELPDLLDRQSATREVRALPVAGSVVGDDVGAIGAGCVILADVLSPRASSLLLEGGAS